MFYLQTLAVPAPYTAFRESGLVVIRPDLRIKLVRRIGHGYNSTDHHQDHVSDRNCQRQQG